MPLGNLDETLRHQLPQTFDTVGTSDPRFFDRYWFSCYNPSGAVTMILGMGLYSNMNVLDGFVACQVPQADGGTTQRNFRYSRALRPNIDHPGVGPLAIEILEPFKRVGIAVEASDQPLELELEWRSFLPPKEEDRHFNRLRGRVTTDYLRYTQVGSMEGSVTLDGKTYQLSHCWGARDHSWGVRPQTAGPEPVTGPAQTELSRQVGSVFYWLPFSCKDFGGHLQIHMLGNGAQTYLDGVIQWPDGSERKVTQANFEVDFHEGTRRWQQHHGRFSWQGSHHHGSQPRYRQSHRHCLGGIGCQGGLRGASYHRPAARPAWHGGRNGPDGVGRWWARLGSWMQSSQAG